MVLLARGVGVLSRLSYPALVPVGVKVMVTVIVAVVEVVLMIVEGSIPATGLPQ